MNVFPKDVTLQTCWYSLFFGKLFTSSPIFNATNSIFLQLYDAKPFPLSQIVFVFEFKKKGSIFLFFFPGVANFGNNLPCGCLLEYFSNDLTLYCTDIFYILNKRKMTTDIYHEMLRINLHFFFLPHNLDFLPRSLALISNTSFITGNHIFNWNVLTLPSKT